MKRAAAAGSGARAGVQPATFSPDAAWHIASIALSVPAVLVRCSSSLSSSLSWHSSHRRAPGTLWTSSPNHAAIVESASRPQPVHVCISPTSGLSGSPASRASDLLATCLRAAATTASSSSPLLLLLLQSMVQGPRRRSCSAAAAARPAGAGPVGALDYELSRCKHNCFAGKIFPAPEFSTPQKPTRAHTPASPSSQVNPKLNRRLRARRRTRFVRFCPDPLCQIFSPRRSPFCPPKNPHARTHRPYPSSHFNPKLNGRLRARRRTRALSVFAQIR